MLVIVHSEGIPIPSWPGFAFHTFGKVPIANASALLLSPECAELPSVIHAIQQWQMPVFVVSLTCGSSKLSMSNSQAITLSLPFDEQQRSVVEVKARQFEANALPPFSKAVADFVALRRKTYACPGHQGGRCYDDHPVGARFKKMLGPTIFQLDVPHAAPELGDVLGHEGPVLQAEQLASQVFQSEKTWFVLNGTSTANKVVTSALLSPGDLVLMDRNNHKSIYIGALVQSGALPVYLETVRDQRGILGGYRSGTLEEDRLRQQATAHSIKKSNDRRPFRLAIVQHATCDGVVVDAGALIQRIGHLCDYILFDSAWAGYEKFVTQMSNLSPLGLALSDESPGLFVTQSVHKQMFGLSQTSQIHKIDKHIKSQDRYCTTHAFNSAFMQHASTSPSYPLLMSLEINAAMLVNGEGKRLWRNTVDLALLLNRRIASECLYLSPLIADESKLTAALESDAYSVDELEPNLHYRDPCKIIVLTRSCSTPEYHRSVPASLITRFLRDHDITPEKTDLYNFTLLVTPSTTQEDVDYLIDRLKHFEKILTQPVPVKHSLPSLTAWKNIADRSVAELCTMGNALYSDLALESLQARIFSSARICTPTATSQFANFQFLRGRARLVAIRQAAGGIAAECILPYPPGVVCAAPGEQFTSELIDYLAAIETLNTCHSWLAQHVQGLHELPGPWRKPALGVYILTQPS